MVCTSGATIDYLNYATGIGIRPRTPVTMFVVFFRFYGDAISGYTYSVVRLFGSQHYLKLQRTIVYVAPWPFPYRLLKIFLR